MTERSRRSVLKDALAAAFVGGCLVVACALAGVPSWIAFVVWTSYALFGNTAKQGLKMFGSYLVGVVVGFGASAIILLLTGAGLPALVGSVIAFGLAIFLLSLLEDTPPLDDIPAYFLGAITFFATGQAAGLPAFAMIAGAGALGLGAGWATVRAQNLLKRS